jgi:PTH1 family peptidyl-tRNA hydrolase
MSWIVAGLGNPGEEYEGTRHNVGRDFLRTLAKKIPKKAKTLTPDSFMNNSGAALQKLVRSKKAAERLVVLQDEIDLPLGGVRLSFGSGSGGHRGVESIIKALGTKNFIRVRIGISPATAAGTVKKPPAEETAEFVLGKFRPAEREKLNRVRKKVGEAIEIILTEGLPSAMNYINTRT